MAELEWRVRPGGRVAVRCGVAARACRAACPQAQLHAHRPWRGARRCAQRFTATPGRAPHPDHAVDLAADVSTAQRRGLEPSSSRASGSSTRPWKPWPARTPRGRWACAAFNGIDGFEAGVHGFVHRQRPNAARPWPRPPLRLLAGSCARRTQVGQARARELVRGRLQLAERSAAADPRRRWPTVPCRPLRLHVLQNTAVRRDPRCDMAERKPRPLHAFLRRTTVHALRSACGRAAGRGGQRVVPRRSSRPMWCCWAWRTTSRSQACSRPWATSMRW